MVLQAGVAVAACLVLVVILAAAGTSPRTPWFVATALCAAIVATGIRLLADAVRGTDWPDPVAAPMVRAYNSDTRVRFLSSQLRQSTKDAHAFRHLVQPGLATLVNARLQRRHGIDATVQPDAARELTGDWLWDLVTTNEPRTPTAAELARAVEIVENL